MRSLVCIALVFSLVGCKHAPDPLVASGESLKIAGNQFVETAQLLERAHDNGLVTDDTYDAWMDFAIRFKPAFEVAYNTWLSADKLKDVSKLESATALLDTLLEELNTWFKMVIKLAKPAKAKADKESL